MPVFDCFHDLDAVKRRLRDHPPPPTPGFRRVDRTPPPLPEPDEVLARCAGDPQRLHATGQLLLHRRAGTHAEACFRRLRDLDPQGVGGDAAVLANLGMAVQIQGRHDEALDLLEQAVAQEPKHPEIRRTLVRLLREMKRPAAEVLPHVEEGLRLAPDDEEFTQLRDQLQFETEA